MPRLCYIRTYRSSKYETGNWLNQNRKVNTKYKKRKKQIVKENQSYVVRHLCSLATEIQRNRRIENKTDDLNWKLMSFSCKFLNGWKNSHTPQCLASHAGVFRGARFSSGRDEKRAPLKTPGWEATQCRVFIVIITIISFARLEQTNWWKPVFKLVSLLPSSKNLEVAKGHDKRKPHRLLAAEVTLGKKKRKR